MSLRANKNLCLNDLKFKEEQNRIDCITCNASEINPDSAFLWKVVDRVNDWIYN